LPITSGNLITITYNLHMTEAIGGPLQRYPTADPRLYPLYKVAKGLLENPDFLPEGNHFLCSLVFRSVCFVNKPAKNFGEGVNEKMTPLTIKTGGPLGIYCTHPYYHTRKLTQTLMPYSLRGIDAITFSVFRALGLKVLIAPVLGDEAWDEWEQVREEKWMRKIYSEEGVGGDEPMEEEESGEEDEGNGDKTRVGKSWHKMRMVSGEGGVGLKVGDDPTSVRLLFPPLILPLHQNLHQNTTQPLKTLLQQFYLAKLI
jgi:hypothetical protein